LLDRSIVTIQLSDHIQARYSESDRHSHKKRTRPRQPDSCKDYFTNTSLTETRAVGSTNTDQATHRYRTVLYWHFGSRLYQRNPLNKLYITSSLRI
jgi:hypothetical protein